MDEPPIDRQKSGCRLLYVGRAVDWFGRLKSVLGPPENRVVYCAGGSTARLLLESDIRYDLFLFDLDLLKETGLELVPLAGSLSHRKHTPIIFVAVDKVSGRLKKLVRSTGVVECLTKIGDMSVAVVTVQRILGEEQP
jgi:DNA-binding response OmpR family regulator